MWSPLRSYHTCKSSVLGVSSGSFFSLFWSMQMVMMIICCDFVCSAKQLVRGEPNVSYICSRYYRAPELIFGATDYTSSIGRLTHTDWHMYIQQEMWLYVTHDKWTGSYIVVFYSAWALKAVYKHLYSSVESQVIIAPLLLLHSDSCLVL